MIRFKLKKKNFGCFQNKSMNPIKINGDSLQVFISILFKLFKSIIKFDIEQFIYLKKIENKS